MISDKSNEADERVEKRVDEVELAEDGFGVNDYISRLPDLCLLNVLKHLTRQDIYNMSLTNSRMWSLADERSLDCIKWMDGILSLYQSVNGYGFRFNVSDINDPNESMTFNYEISKDENGVLIEKKSLRNFGDELPCYKNTHCTWSVPEQFTSNLIELMRHRDVNSVRIYGFPIDAEFYSKLSKELDGHSFESIQHECLHFPILDEPITEEGRMSSSQYLINEQFIKGIHGGNLTKFSSAPDRHPVINEIRGVTETSEKIDHFFRASQSILSYFIGFEILEVPTMILNPLWLPDLCMMYIESLADPSDKECWLQFAIDRTISSSDFSRSMRNGFEYSFDDEEDTHYIKRMNDGTKARIEVIDYELEGETIHGLSIIVYGKEKDYEMEETSDEDDE